VKSLAQVIAANAARNPEGLAFLEAERRLSWRDYHERSDRLAGVLVGLDFAPGERVAVWLPDGPGVHVVWLGCEKAGLVVVGIGPRAGLAEVRHLLEKTGAAALVSRAQHRDVDVCRVFEELRDAGVSLRHHVVIESDVEPEEPVFEGASPSAGEARALGPEALFLLNSTSGTTGLPKCVTQHQARWFHFHELAVEAADLDERDVFMSLLPAPFGFGLWTAHFTPALLGAPTLLMERFDADLALAAIEEHRVSVLAAVSTQFILLLNSPEIAERDLSSLRVLFTGGEAVPMERAVEFEDRTGAAVLQFYGSNETGALSRTTLRDSREVRLGSAGHVIESMQVRLFDDDGADVTATGQGQPGCRGALTCRGYYEDDAANAKLVREDGWMLTGDVATLEDGVLRVIGRTADFIIRGGKNISGPAVEAAVSTHPAVVLAAAVAMPDPVFGERVCVYAELHEGTTLTLEELLAHLAEADVSKEWFPERLEILDSLPRASGGKVAKQALREDIRRRLG